LNSSRASARGEGHGGRRPSPPQEGCQPHTRPGSGADLIVRARSHVPTLWLVAGLCGCAVVRWKQRAVQQRPPARLQGRADAAAGARSSGCTWGATRLDWRDQQTPLLVGWHSQQPTLPQLGVLSAQPERTGAVSFFSFLAIVSRPDPHTSASMAAPVAAVANTRGANRSTASPREPSAPASTRPPAQSAGWPLGGCGARVRECPVRPHSPTPRRDRGRSASSAPGGSGVSAAATSSGRDSTGNHSCSVGTHMTV
jgi:hypothetical protein